MGWQHTWQSSTCTCPTSLISSISTSLEAMQYGHENPMARVKLIVATVILIDTLAYVAERSSDHIEANFGI